MGLILGFIRLDSFGLIQLTNRVTRETIGVNMGKLKDLLKYTPPDFLLFEKNKEGLLFEAGFNVDYAYSEFVRFRKMDS